MNDILSSTLSRRDALRLAAVGAVSAGAAAAGVLATPGQAHAEAFPAGFTRPVATPDEALRALREGNARFVAGRVTEPHRNLARVREVAPTQTPFASVLGCADSRVPVELVFDQGFGDLFVCRAAGNIVSPEILGSLEFGTLVLGSKLLLVLGHSACGAVKATIAGEAVPGQISALYQHIQPAVDAAGTDVEAAITENVRIQARLLSRSSPVIGGLIEEGKLKVVGGVYDLNTGAVKFLEG
ncbi:MAG: carbonic anhydrase [Gemmatimonadota bacterium]